MKVPMTWLLCVALCVSHVLLLVSSAGYEDFNPELADRLLKLAETSTTKMRNAVRIDPWHDDATTFSADGATYPARVWSLQYPPPEFGSSVRVTMFGKREDKSVNIVITDDASDQLRAKQYAMWLTSSGKKTPLESRFCARRLTRSISSIGSNGGGAGGGRASASNAATANVSGDCSSFNIHPAFKTAYSHMELQMQINLQALMHDFTGPVFITGFSLSGGLAAMFGYSLHQLYKEKTVVTYTFSQTMVGDQKFTDAIYASRMILFRCAGKDDFTPFVPPACGAAISYKQAGTLVLYDRDIGQRFDHAKIKLCKPSQVAECVSQQAVFTEVTDWCHVNKDRALAHMPTRTSSSKPGSSGSGSSKSVATELQNVMRTANEFEPSEARDHHADSE